MRIINSIFILSLISFLVICGCQKDAVGINDGQGTLRIYVTDATADYDSVKITFSKISAHSDSGWISVIVDPVTVDLLKWSNGKKFLVGSADVPASKYTQIRLIIDDAEIGVKGKVWPLTVPSGAQTGLKFGPQFTIEEGLSYELVIDFDVCKSIVVNGSKKNPKSYKLKPHIRIVAAAVTGSISGIVANNEDAPTAYAVQGEDTVSTAMADRSSGYFMLGFLPAGEYQVSVADTIGLSYGPESIEVVTGTNYDLGIISLE